MLVNWLSGKKKKIKALIFLVFANYPGVNASIVVDFKLLRFNKKLANF